MGAQQGGTDAIKRMQLAAAGRARRADAIGRGKEGRENINRGLGGVVPDMTPGSTFFGGPQQGQVSTTLGPENKGSFAEFLVQLANNRKGKS